MTEYYKLTNNKPKSAVTFFNVPIKVIIFFIQSAVIPALYSPLMLCIFDWSHPVPLIFNSLNGISINSFLFDLLPFMMIYFWTTCAMSIPPLASLLKASYYFIQCTILNESCDVDSDPDDLFEILIDNFHPIFGVFCIYHIYNCYQLIKDTTISNHLEDKQVFEIDNGSETTRFYRVDDVQPKPPVTFFNNPVENVFLVLTLLIIFVMPYVRPMNELDLPQSVVILMGSIHIIAFCAYMTDIVPVMMAHFTCLGMLSIMPILFLSLTTYCFIKQVVFGYALVMELAMLDSLELLCSLTDSVIIDGMKVALITLASYFYYISLCYSMIKHAIITNHLKDKQIISIQ